MTVEELKSDLLIKKQLLTLSEEELLQEYDDPDDFFSFFQGVWRITWSDDFLFYHHQDLVCKLFSIVSTYREEQRGTSYYSQCNELIEVMNRTFRELTPDDYQMFWEEYTDKQIELRFLGKRSWIENLDPSEVLERYLIADFDQFEIIDRCAAGKFTGRSFDKEEKDIFTQLRETPLWSLQVEGYDSEDDLEHCAYEYITDTTFLSTINYLMINYSDVWNDHPEYGQIAYILLQKALEERQELRREDKKTGQYDGSDFDKHYDLWSRRTQINVNYMHSAIEGKQPSPIAKPKEKVMQLFSKFKKREEKA